MFRLAAFSSMMVVVMWLCGSQPASGADEGGLVLRVEDGAAAPGATLAVVLRTYSPRGIGQGQICLRPPLRGGASPLAALEGFHVFSQAGDADFEAVFDADSQTLLLDFSSSSASINKDDGPLAVLYFQLDSGLAPGTEFQLLVDPGPTFLLDAAGQPIAVEPREGDIEVLAPTDPYSVEIDDADAAPGGVAAVALATDQSRALHSGQVVVNWDPVQLPWPRVTMDSRHGAAQWQQELLAPGRLKINFVSPDNSLNIMPGGIIDLSFLVPVGTAVGTEVAIAIEAAETWLLDAEGQSLDLELADGLVIVEADTPVFSDGFESGDLTGWCVSRP